MMMWVLLVISIILGAFGQIFMSVAMKAMGGISFNGSVVELGMYYVRAALSWSMVGAVLCYGVSFLLWLAVLSRKDLSLARPMMSLGYLVTMAYGIYAGEDMNLYRVLGTLVIVVGIFLMIMSDQMVRN